MTPIRKFEKPLGMRDSFPLINEKKEKVRDIGRRFFQSRGFDFIKTPTVEYYETIGKASAIPDSSLFKLVDRQGETLVLRPDMTTPIVRVATSKLLKEQIPLRLAYFANVFRAQEHEGGRPAEFEQMGVELIGDDSVYADAEMIITASEFVQELGIDSYRLTVGHAGLLQSILTQLTQSEEQVKELRKLLVEKNMVGFEDAVRTFGLSNEDEQRFIEFIGQASNVQSIQQLRPFIDETNDAQVTMFSYLNDLSSLLENAGLSKMITYDLTLTSEMSYYTGMLFEVFASGSGFAIGNGGRYDGLLQAFNSDVGATGFGLRVDRLLEVMTTTTTREPHTLILFDSANYAKAVHKAVNSRNQGIRTTIQYKESVEDQEAFQANFSDVVWLIEGDGNNE
ncbi:ATP phosphoribosyltransferase regulatory subunit [Paenisporosarcina macmurdoensis]|uniref:ATP phosphoribosyltransferase regulatory subunit n=1 Tax=Paenisporosarcina macmurdoensis TaxID=212659 RepID=A0ABW1L8H4_9BACL